MQASVQSVWEQFERIHQAIFQWSEGLSDDQLNWRPPAKDSNSIGNLMSHILGAELFSIVERVGGESVGRDRPGEFHDRVTRDMLLQRRADVEKRVRQTLEKLTPADFSRVVQAPIGEVTVDKFLLYLISHFSGHMGQVILTRKLIDAQH